LGLAAVPALVLGGCGLSDQQLTTILQSTIQSALTTAVNTFISTFISLPALLLQQAST
jgi:hypothetical protein